MKYVTTISLIAFTYFIFSLKVMLLAERNKGFNTDVYRRSLNVVDKDVKYSGKL